MGFGAKIIEGDTWYELSWGLKDIGVEVLRVTDKRVSVVEFDGECLSMTRDEFRNTYHYKVNNSLLPLKAEIDRVIKLNMELWK